MSAPLTYNGRIAKVRFALSGNITAERDSVVPINSHDLFRNNMPYAGGVYDAHLGTTDYSYRCQTCFNSKRACTGHEGLITLNYPVWNPMGVTDAKKWLKLICFNCGDPIIPESQYMMFPRSKRLDEASKIARVGNKKCHQCRAVHPMVKKHPTEPLALYEEILEDKRQVDKKIIYPHQAAKIFSRITDDTIIKMGKSINSRPGDVFILYNIKVPSVIIRPDVKKMGGGGRSTNDDLTTMLQVIIKRNESMPSTIPDTIDMKLERAIFDLSNAYYDFVKASGENSINSLARRLKGKQGRFRKNQLGKRVRNMCRSTITGDPTIRIDQVGVPLSFARTIQYEEIVQEYNKKKLLRLVQNGRTRYPGATKIIKKSTGAEYDVDSIREIDLEIGDIVLRDMINGDPVNFNRQPSLMVSNISCHRAVITRDPKIKTLLMNVLVCPLYNADFDGDAMHLIISSGVAARNEISKLSSVSQWFVSHTTSSPALGQVDDSIIGLAELTRSGVNYNKYNAMLLFSNSTYLPSFSEMTTTDDKISGRDLISKSLDETPINFTRVPEWYKQNMAQFINYDPTEIKVTIEQGKLLQGILDKKSIGKGANGGIYHIIANEYGADKALEVMFNMQQMAIGHTLQQGYTIGIMDLVISPESKAEIDRIAADIVNKSLLITEKLQSGEIIPPIGKTVEEFFEEQQINTLSIFDDFSEPILKAINHETNNLFKLVMFGSKGKIDNIFNMISSIGQKLINGERIRQKFGFKRTLAYFPRFDASPEARGYIANSYINGMNSIEYIFNAMAARFDLITKALSTSITGEQNRKSIKNLESIIINNYRWAMKNTSVIELAYGEDFLDPRKVERVKFPTVMCSDATLESTYKYTLDKHTFDEEYNKIREDRQKYRDIFMKVEHMNTKELMQDVRFLGVNVERVVFDCLKQSENMQKQADLATLKTMCTTIKTFVHNLPYTLINEIQERRQSKIPEYIDAAAWLLQMAVRSYLHPAFVHKSHMTPVILRQICEKIKMVYSHALIEPGTAAGIIAAQSFSEPLTQYMLDAHHRSASGGTSKSTMNHAKEILGAKDLSKLQAPTMLIPCLPEIAVDKTRVQEIANSIEVMKFHQFVSSWQIFFEKFGEPIHPQYAHEVNMLKDFARHNPLLTPPADLIKWCIRLSLNKTALILKNMALELLVIKLKEAFPEIYIVYTPENAKEVVLRVYLKATMFKGQIATDDLKAIKDNILKTIIRGVDGITNTQVVKMIRNKIMPDGSVVRDDNNWGISANGSNLRGIFAIAGVDKSRVHTDAIQEMARVFGIECARQKIVSELRGLVDSCNHRHYLTYADEMTFTGRVTSIESSGLKTRESSNVLLRIGFSSPLATMEEAAVNSSEDAVTGVTAPLLVGSIPRHGTLFNQFFINKDFVKANVKKPDDILDQLLD